jgi:hypothetical protein
MALEQGGPVRCSPGGALVPEAPSPALSDVDDQDPTTS